MSTPGLRSVAFSLVVVLILGGLAVFVLGYPVAILGTLALLAAVALLGRAMAREMFPRR